jgi:capsular exopolysaccharide synthesis family protein
MLVADRADPRRRIRPNSKVWHSIVQDPTSAGAEAIRSLKLSLDLIDEAFPGKVIGLTSALPAEGKSTIAVAVAASLAQSGKRVILIDGDLRNPSLSRSLAPDARVGFVEVVQGNTILPEAVWYDPTTRLDFLPAVVDPSLPCRTDVFAANAAQSFFSALRTRYEYVIVDLAPLVAGVDVQATLRPISSYLLVIEWGVTKIEDLQYALRQLPNVQDNIVGVVLNRVDMDAIGLYDRYGAHYYYGRPRLAQSN